MNVYVVKGSEDGYCGTYGSKKRALQYAMDYITQGEECEVETREYDHIIVLEGNGVSVEIYKDEVQ